MFRKEWILLFASMLLMAPAWAKRPVFFGADHPEIQYTGRIDFTNPKMPRFWTAGVYIKAKF